MDVFQDDGGKSDSALFNFTIINEDDLPPAFIPGCESSSACTPTYTSVVNLGHIVSTKTTIIRKEMCLLLCSDKLLIFAITLHALIKIGPFCHSLQTVLNFIFAW
jgi:hypothetical protein